MDDERKTLGTELPKEMARVRDLIPLYQELPHDAGRFAIVLMKHDLDAAAKAMMEGDVVEMLRVYESLKGFRE